VVDDRETSAKQRAKRRRRGIGVTEPEGGS